MKLFEMSILWRACVSSHPVFSRVQLGPHEARLRAMLLAEDPGEPEHYGCLQTPALLGGRPVVDYIAQPTSGRLGSHRAYRLLFGGFLWLYFVSSHRLEEPWRLLLLQSDGSRMIVSHPRASEEYFTRISRQFKESRAAERISERAHLPTSRSERTGLAGN